MIKVLPAVLAVAFLYLAPVPAAHAQPACDGDFAKIGGQWIATPQCQLAEARSAAHVHSSASRAKSGSAPKVDDNLSPEDICRRTAGDIRSATFCSAYND
ncbi:hypothetical protein [Hyphomicrobium facile]|uniref:YARHG domain-containing protein n=1 Tax=Hyphomicrobium facile TaxID=51670 RepID=A0A1I7NVF2_9HYPH|nr:hypothetical protein [Hyphomicrobium facile]SFV38649.1 hypothetical protein SAMN04488557_3775 [Hyphomicrobium facile]